MNISKKRISRKSIITKVKIKKETNKKLISKSKELKNEEKFIKKANKNKEYLISDLQFEDDENDSESDLNYSNNNKTNSNEYSNNSMEVDEKNNEKNKKSKKNNNKNSKNKKISRLYINSKKKNNVESEGEKSSSESKNLSESENEEEEDYSKNKLLNYDFLPCREKEQDKIYDYLKKGLLTSGDYSSLYIGGMPGTGKTECVKTVLKKLKKDFKNKKCKSFNQIFINGMKIQTPTAVYRSIYTEIFNNSKGMSIKNFIKNLDEFFRQRENYTNTPELRDPSNPHIILIIDEIDCLINQKQTLLYNIFNWTKYPFSKLIVISISNTLDLKVRLEKKISSRMGTNQIIFAPYDKDALYKIVKFKNAGFDFNEDALKIISMKVAAINGDLRRIFQIIKKAKEIFELENKNSKKILITKIHVLKACNELFNSKLINVIKSLSFFEKIILAIIVWKIKDKQKIKILEIFDKKNVILNKFNNENEIIKINWEEFQYIIYNLINLKIIFFSETPKINFIENYISIKFYADEFMNAIEEEEEFKNVLEFLQEQFNN